ncbi:uncharacterized protein LOC131855158 [Achroia grisella]|uniref:uncharacterized protein LOC131855158 n=1 Tax=Achroia grisella TaxID=688607 RepID=UPI0027D2D89F|nr:uncharacterized protein LOC131855158 [Achroia grisella]
MPRKPCYWTRKLELDLVEFVRQRDFIWKPIGNTNHHIQQKYKAYAEFAAKLGRGFTARSVRDRWVNIRSTFNHNLRRVDKSRETAQNVADIYVPCWPLWKPLQFLREVPRKEESGNYQANTSLLNFNTIDVKEELQSDFDDGGILKIRQRGQRTNRPRHVPSKNKKVNKNNKCKQFIDDLVRTMEPLNNENEHQFQSYFFFGKHITERLNSMRDIDAECAAREIINLLDTWPTHEET